MAHCIAAYANAVCTLVLYMMFTSRAPSRGQTRNNCTIVLQKWRRRVAVAPKASRTPLQRQYK
ncbi:unknown [Orgyia pseudotsugata multiple nucleopolyhedrovirus]|uniref:Uncharacterized protein n=1 Tax=Orgyia pseudotsugata multicapsid polyhedrosis virus TaxID=262177 RepID=O10289_NPVOP|nr:hypothetical protein OpmnVgp033 [Orgyia pseudotsugata multiple nucleopolyhedrovirus]AAC59032.1 unknown [Orgyia pseudotsugata multiple nucleopolyhedrovirus]